MSQLVSQKALLVILSKLEGFLRKTDFRLEDASGDGHRQRFGSAEAWGARNSGTLAESLQKAVGRSVDNRLPVRQASPKAAVGGSEQ